MNRNEIKAMPFENIVEPDSCFDFPEAMDMDRKKAFSIWTKQETLKMLEKITGVRLKPRNFEDLLKEANKWYREAEQVRNIVH